MISTNRTVVGVLCLALFGCSQQSLQTSKEQGEAFRHCMGALRVPNMKECIDAKTEQLVDQKESERARTTQRAAQQAAAKRIDRNTMALAIDPIVPGTIYAGTLEQGILKSNDGGQTWTEINGWIPSVVYQGEPKTPRVTLLAIDPATSSIVYAVSTRGLHKTTDGGASWKPLFEGKSSVTVTSIAIGSQSPETLYLGSIRGVSKSTDGGHSWIDAGLTEPTHALAVDPQNNNIVYAKVEGPKAGIYKATDGGGHWKQVYRGSEPVSLAVDRIDSNLVYAGTYSGFFKSTDGGDSWQPIGSDSLKAFTGPVKALIIHPKEKNIIYAMTGHSIHKSIDGGENWRALEHAMTGLFARDFNGFGVDPSSHSIYVGSRGGEFSELMTVMTYHTRGSAQHRL